MGNSPSAASVPGPGGYGACANGGFPIAHLAEGSGLKNPPSVGSEVRTQAEELQLKLARVRIPNRRSGLVSGCHISNRSSPQPPAAALAYEAIDAPGTKVYRHCLGQAELSRQQTPGVHHRPGMCAASRVVGRA